MSKTSDNLKQAFSGEAQANRKYLAFAKQAEKEGFPQAAKLFRAVAEAETVHAHAHLKHMGGIGTTEENLKAAMDGEIHEFTKMYPQMIADAREEGLRAVERGFHFANEVEKIHASLYAKALESLGKEENADYYVCSVCGYTCEYQAPDKCPVCNAARKAFFIVH
ncbi:MAG TPA: rubrerythrin family protein [Desulfonatronum sp.]|nr:rubrerythrin family protein [Desulfonatronum sp.]